MMTKNLRQDAPGEQKNAKRSLLSVLFTPQVGANLSPLRETTRIFVHLVASVFMVYKLIPQDYPGLNDAGIPISFFNVIRTAWRNLRFTRESAPQVILFFALTGFMGFAVLLMISAAMSLFVGHAHASDVSMFTPPASTDLATQWITFLFDKDNSAAALTSIASTTNTVMPSVTVQTALTSALALYSNAILIIAAVILFYHLAAMIVETAHHGQVMGKEANQIWAPIRLVFAIGLLVPISGGLNCGQYIVIKLAEMGSGLASNVWAGFVGRLATDSSKMPPLAPAGAGANLANDLVMMYACEYSFNAQISFAEKMLGGVAFSSDAINGWGWSQGGTPTGPTNNSNNPQKYSFTNQTLGDYDLCGSYTIPPKPLMSDTSIQPVADSIYTATVAAFMAANPTAAAVGAEIDSVMPADPTSVPPFVPSTTRPTHQDVQNVADTLQTALNAAVTDAAVGDTITNAVAALKAGATAEGWVSAGAWFNKLSSFQAEINDVAEMSLPGTSPPTIETRNDEDAMESQGFFAHARDFLSGFLALGVVGGVGNVVGQNALHEKSHSHYRQTLLDLSAFAGTIAVSPPANSKLSMQSPSCSLTDPMLCILSLVDWVAVSRGVWNNPNAANGNAIGVTFAGKDPLMEIAAFGHRAIEAGLYFFDFGIGVAAGSGVLSGLSIIPGVGAFIGVLGSLGMAAAALLFFIGVIFFSIGMLVAYFIPLLPFMHFFFNTITWVACVAESIIAIPLVALAHLTPKGAGLSGEQAKGAYTMLFSVFLRPVLMIFGLICGLLIMYVGVGLLNALYAYAIAGASVAGQVGSHAAVSRLMYTAIYVMILYSIANHSFGLISRLPNEAMKWMGGTGMNGQQMGDVQRMETLTGLAGSYIGDKAAGKLQSGAAELGAGVGKGIGGGVKALMSGGKGGGGGPSGYSDPKSTKTDSPAIDDNYATNTLTLPGGGGGGQVGPGTGGGASGSSNSGTPGSMASSARSGASSTPSLDSNYSVNPSPGPGPSSGGSGSA